jgi:hypothetical protein
MCSDSPLHWPNRKLVLRASVSLARMSTPREHLFLTPSTIQTTQPLQTLCQVSAVEAI